MMKAPDVTMMDAEEGQTMEPKELIQQQEAVLKRVYKVGNQEYVLLKVHSADLAGQQASQPKQKTEQDYLKAICGQKDEV